MALTTEQLEKAWPWWVANRTVNSNNIPCKFTKEDIRAALVAATDWIEANQSKYVTSLNPTPFGGANSTADEKLRIFLTALAFKFDIKLDN